MRRDRAGVRSALLCPFPLRERAARCCHTMEWVRGIFARTPHPFELVATPLCPLPQGERAREARAAHFGRSKKERPHPKERACEIVPRIRRRVRACRRMRTSQLMRPHASRRRAAHAKGARLRELACAARLLSMRAGEAKAGWPNVANSFMRRRTNLWL